MKARINKVKKEYGGEIGVAAIVTAAVVGYSYWGSMLLN